MALSLGELPRYLVLEPTSSVRLEVALVRPACEIDIGLDAPKPGRSFLLLIGPEGGPMVQRMRVTGRARILFEPRDQRPQVLMLANPLKEPLVLSLHGHLSRGRPEHPTSRDGGSTPMRPRPLRNDARRRARLPPPAPPFAASVAPGAVDLLHRRARPKA